MAQMQIRAQPRACHTMTRPGPTTSCGAHPTRDRHAGTTCLARMFHWLGTVPVHKQTGCQYIIVSFGP